MTALVRAELLKLRTVRSWWAYLITIVVLAGLATANEVGPSDVSRTTLDAQVRLMDLAAIAALLAIILGITAVTMEFRHGTITPTSLAEPHRERVLAAKGMAAGLVGVGFALLALAVIFAVAWIWLTLVDVEVHLLEADVLTRAAQGLLLALLWTLLGVAVGSVVHSQIAALVGTLIWLFLAENVVGALLGVLDLDGVSAYLPFRALDAADGTGGEDALSYGGGVAVALAWIAVIGGAGLVRTRSRDLT